jgi:hypothetical protein
VCLPLKVCGKANDSTATTENNEDMGEFSQVVVVDDNATRGICGDTFAISFAICEFNFGLVTELKFCEVRLAFGWVVSEWRVVRGVVRVAFGPSSGGELNVSE